MTACPGPLGLPFGPCENCRRPLALYAGRLEHRRGRITGVSPARSDPLSLYERAQAMAPMARRRFLLGLPWDELEAAGICECGQRLAGHPPLPKPAPLRSKASEDRRQVSPEAQARMDASRVPAQAIWGSQPLGAR